MESPFQTLPLPIVINMTYTMLITVMITPLNPIVYNNALNGSTESISSGTQTSLPQYATCKASKPFWNEINKVRMYCYGAADKPWQSNGKVCEQAGNEEFTIMVLGSSNSLHYPSICSPSTAAKHDADTSH